jgi:hypothetical protein
MPIKPTADDIHEIMVRTGDVRVANLFADEIRKVDAKPHLVSDAMKHVLSETDQKKAPPNDVVTDAVAALTHEQREAMATLALAGYKFHRGTFYWRCLSPDNKTVDSLQVYLNSCIAAAMVHNEERLYGKHQPKP